MLRIKERLLRAWLACKRLTGLSFPRRFPIVQFPNLPLIVAVLAGAAGKFLDGSAHSYAASVSYLAQADPHRQEVAAEGREGKPGAGRGGQPAAGH